MHRIHPDNDRRYDAIPGPHVCRTPSTSGHEHPKKRDPLENTEGGRINGIFEQEPLDLCTVDTVEAALAALDGAIESGSTF
jgi:hypothetical protein